MPLGTVALRPLHRPMNLSLSPSDGERVAWIFDVVSSVSQASTPYPDSSIYQLESSWTNDFGQAVKLNALRGRVQVIAMFFANCTYACPIIVHDMHSLEKALPDDVRD